MTKKRHWLPETLSLIKAEPALKAAYYKVRQSLSRNGNILPAGLDFTLPYGAGEPWYNPLEQWREARWRTWMS